jgi:Glycosyl-hydrolase 97 N-terminal
MRLAALVLLASVVFAQDEHRITSPDGQVEFRLFIATEENNFSRIAYEVFYRGQPILKTSFMGLDIDVQEPLLGENAGLTSFSTTKGSVYNSLIAKYMQNGSLGRLINVEARAYNDGVAFRYIIPPSTPLMEMRIVEEATEFQFAEPIGEGNPVHLRGSWIAITESKQGSYPPMRLTLSSQTTQLTRLIRPYQTTAPLTCPWRIVSIGATADKARQSAIIADLTH